MFTALMAAVAGAVQQVFLLIAYISGLNSFPRKLTPAEEQSYLEAHYTGDDQARGKLIEHNLRLVAHVAKKYTAIGYDADDLISVGTIGLIKGVDSYNGGKNTKLATYVGRCIENEILMVIRTNKKCDKDISIEEPIGTDREGNQITFNDILSNEHDEVLDEVSKKILIKNMMHNIETTLDGRDKKIIMMRYGLEGYIPKTQSEVANELKISRSYVSRIEKKALEKLSENIEKSN